MPPKRFTEARNAAAGSPTVIPMSGYVSAWTFLGNMRLVDAAVMRKAAFADEFMRYVSVDDDASCVLRELKKKYKLGLISNFGIPECGHKLLENFGLRKFFDMIIISAEVNQRKPSPEIFKKALLGLNVDASEAVFVGDMLELDVKGPKSIGIKAILIERKPTEAEASIKPDRVIKSLPELLTILEDD
jgi:HAD superfamily hydrolase (TIGR01549 family)